MPGFLIGLLLTAAYWPGISGAATSPRWIIAAMIFPTILFLKRERIVVTVPHLVGLLFLAWSLASFFWSEHPESTIGAAWHLLILLAAFGAGRFLENPRQLYLGAAAGLLISDGCAFAQLAGWQGLLWANVPAGLFVNRNFFAEASALVAVALVAERLWWALPATAPGLLFTSARGAILGLGAALVVMTWRRSKPAAILMLFVPTLGIVALTLVGNKFATIQERFDIWRSASAIVNWRGYGLGTFLQSAPVIPWIPYHVEHAYNEFLEAAFETGWVGCGLLIAFAASLLIGALTTERLVLIALLVEASFGYPFHMPTTAILGCIVAGRVAYGLPRVRDALGACGMALRAGLSRRAISYRGGTAS
jgi:hypothetical protein